MGPAARPPLTQPRRAAEAVAVVLVALALAGGLILLGDPDLRGDQNAYNLLVAKKLSPGLLTRDALYRYEPDLLHVPWFLNVQAALARRLGGDVERALAWLGWLMGALFIVGHYVFFRVVSGRVLPAALATLAALTVRNALGGEVWGFDGMPAAATRTIVAGLTPPLLLLFLWWRERRVLAGYWALLGVLFNVHPVSAYQLAQVTALAHLWRERSLRALGQVALGIALFVAAALPYLVPFFGARLGGGDPATVRAALDYRFPYLLYPIAPNALLSVAFHMALPLGAWLAWRRRRQSHPVLTPLVPVMGAALVLGFGATALIQAAGIALDRPYADIQELRVLRLLYPIALGGLALLYARWLERRTAASLAAVAVLVLLSLVPPGEVVHAFSWETRAKVKHALGMGPAPAAALPTEVSARPALWRWTRASTSESALF
ncbi:MAG TPA: hypothetical protein VFW70_09315, partial [Methylomirabilota bacterium]|nr:hypothetical protein [Methylomirabilota bacterium]